MNRDNTTINITNLLRIAHLQRLLIENSGVLDEIVHEVTEPLSYLNDAIKVIKDSVDLKRFERLAECIEQITAMDDDIRSMTEDDCNELRVNEETCYKVINVNQRDVLLQELERKAARVLPICMVLVKKAERLLFKVREKIVEMRDILRDVESVCEEEKYDKVVHLLVVSCELIRNQEWFSKGMSELLKRTWHVVVNDEELCIKDVIQEVLDGCGRGGRRISVLGEEVKMHTTKVLWKYVLEDVVTELLRRSNGKIEVVVQKTNVELRDYGNRIGEEEAIGILRDYGSWKFVKYGAGLSYSRLVMLRLGGDMSCEVGEGYTAFKLRYRKYKKEHMNILR
ncbi:hypothetical protein EDM53_01690 [Rickettsiales endosymbiont of Peranema trichophorum]|uniref:hypothetical protein n=1 Tax=Rickettsiales endosymbiont of Peranema trichophorum TaxID=2486577 RepID=UPI001022A318|nr:hypothetical protein [Rickettsiales endosymbiont of Peranema trichophorum]RZI47481.1 hypothetical protein EDM53_01690 [Rickettsiales endosymbiont of Peranema trichophorum]